MSVIISPSILNSDFLKLGESITMLNSSEADWIHLDIMDGVFVPNITFGLPVVAQIKKQATKPLDVHLMIAQPEKYIDAFHDAGADWLTIHFEAATHLHRAIQQIKAKGMKAGVALNPHTSVTSLEEIIQDVDLVLNMTVNPGYGGQKFIESSYSKISRLKELIIKKNSKALIQVDGGVDLNNIKKLRDAGVDSFVVGTYVFRSADPISTIHSLKTI